jgi:GNAT superfamily N-acetyltransferase
MMAKASELDLPAGFAVRSMTPEDLDTALGWAAQEGWNPGEQDAHCFRAADPEGFLVGTLDGEPVTSISMVRYDADFAFLGLYIARPEARGRGLGYATWRAAMALAGDRVVGLDGVVAQQDNYASEGFVYAHRNQRYGGRPTRLPEAHAEGIEIGDGSAASFDALCAYDSLGFPSRRVPFLKAWLSAPGHVLRLALRGGALCGYGVLRPCREGAKIGPLFADAPEIAEALAGALLREAPDGPVYLDPPGTNASAVALAQSLGLEPVFETARMYRGPAPAFDLGRVFGITTFELG